MSIQEGLVPPALPDRARPFRWGYYAIRVLLVAVLLAGAALLPRDRGPGDRYRYHEGDISRERIVASYAFPIDKDEVTLRRQQEEAASSVPPVFVVDARVSSEMFTRFAAFRERALAIVLDPVISPDDRRNRVRALGVPLAAEAAVALSSPGRARRALDGLNEWLHHVYDVGVISFEKRDALVLGYHRVTVREGDGELGRRWSECAARLLDSRAGLLASCAGNGAVGSRLACGTVQFQHAARGFESPGDLQP